MVRIAAIAARVRPALPGAVLLTLIALIPWAEHHESRVVPPAVSVVRIPSLGGELVLTPWDVVQLSPQHFDVLVPPSHPDARDYPLGMVMGRHTPSGDPQIQIWFDSPFANVLSVFLVPWQALTHQLGT